MGLNPLLLFLSLPSLTPSTSTNKCHLHTSIEGVTRDAPQGTTSHLIITLLSILPKQEIHCDNSFNRDLPSSSLIYSLSLFPSLSFQTRSDNTSFHLIIRSDYPNFASLSTKLAIYEVSIRNLSRDWKSL